MLNQRYLKWTSDDDEVATTFTGGFSFVAI